MPSLGESLVGRDFVAAFIYVVDVELVVGDDEVGARRRTGERVRVLRRHEGVGSCCQTFCRFALHLETGTAGCNHGLLVCGMTVRRYCASASGLLVNRGCSL